MSMVREMVVEFKFGLMVRYMRDIGKTVSLMERAASFMQMEIFKMGTGYRTKPMVMVNILMLMVLNISVNGLMTSNMAKERNNGRMELLSKVTTN